MKVAHHGSEDPGLADELSDSATSRRGDLVRSEQRLRTPAARDARRARGRARSRGLSHRPGRTRRHRVRRPETHRSNAAVVWRIVADAPDKLVYLITGSDRPEDRNGAHAAPRPLRAGGDRVGERTRPSGEDAVGLCNAGSLFGDARLIVVTDVDGRKDGEGRRKGGWKAADVDAIVGYLASPAPATVLALVGRGAEGELGSLEGVREGGRGPARSTSRRRSCTSWVAEQFQRPRRARRARRGDGADPARRRRPARARSPRSTSSRPGLRESRSANARSWRSSRRTPDVPIYELTEAWSAHDSARALDVSETIFERRSEAAARRRSAARRRARRPRRQSAVAQAARRRGREAEGGSGTTEAASVQRAEARPARPKVSRRRSSTTRCVRLAELDGALKGQSRLAPDLELQRTLVDLSAASRRRAGERSLELGGSAGDESRGPRLLARRRCSDAALHASPHDRSSERARDARRRYGRRRRPRQPSRAACVSVLIVER